MNRSLTIMCIHGVGLWPGLFDDLDFGAPAVSVIRPGYGPVRAAGTLDEQVDVLADIAESRAPVALVGVSGGATLSLACASLGVPGVVAAVSHEPLVGHLEPEIDDRVRAGAGGLEANPTKAQVSAFLESLYGADSWVRMPAEAHAWAADHLDVVRREVRHFSDYQPSAAEMRDMPVPHLTTVGAHSNAARHRVAALLREGGSQASVVEGSGHHVLIDQPHDFAAIVHKFLTEVM